MHSPVSDDASPFCDDEPERPRSANRAHESAWKVLIVDDEQEIHDVTTLALEGLTFSDRTLSFLSARSAREASAMLSEHPDLALVLLDVVMETDDAGLRLVRHIRNALGNSRVRVVMRTGQPGQAPETDVILDYDISDYRTKTELTLPRLFTTVVAALRSYQQLMEVEAQRNELEHLYREQKQAAEEVSRLKAALERERDYLREEVKEARGGEILIGSSPAFARVLEQVEAVASSDATVLLLGESGVGKEVIARALHARSHRAAGPLVKVNCASIPRELFESEFFGHVKGAFTGAHRDRVGRFQLADGGTIFLDEVGDLHEASQAKLLRILQDGELQRVGGEQPIRVTVRVVSATNRRLDELIAAGRFREDLYYRLSVVPIRVPALRERLQDVAELASYFLAEFCARNNFRRRAIDPDVVPALERYAWPGNVRELRNLVERMAILTAGDRITIESIPLEIRERQALRSANGLQEVRDSAERERIRQALDQTDWNVSAAARLLETERTALHKRIRTLGLRRS
jgi:DNA-binding NtrC family response regulator